LQVVALAVCAAAVYAEPEAEADPSLLYAGYGYAPYTYGYGYAPYTYGYNYGYPYTYGYPYAYGAYGHYLGKREAEAEADPSLLYAGYAGYAPYAYAYAPYWWVPRAASYQHIATPFSVSTVSQIHKREAEADADAHVALAYAPLAYTGVAVHPGLATSYEYRSPQGLHALYRPWGYYGYYWG
jgi:hypothetical protein